MLVNARGERSALPDKGLFEQREPSGKRLINSVAMSCDCSDCLISGFGKRLIQIIGSITDRCNRLLRGGIKILPQQSGIIRKGSNGAFRGCGEMLADPVCLFGYCPERCIKRRGKALMQGFGAACEVRGGLLRHLY